MTDTTPRPKAPSKAFPVMLPPTKISTEMADRIDQVARRPEVGSKAAAVRRLLELGLEALA